MSYIWKFWNKISRVSELWYDVTSKQFIHIHMHEQKHTHTQHSPTVDQGFCKAWIIPANPYSLRMNFMIACHHQLSLPPPSFTPLSHVHTLPRISSRFDSNFNKLLQIVACMCVTAAKAKNSGYTCYFKSGPLELGMTLLWCHACKSEKFVLLKGLFRQSIKYADTTETSFTWAKCNNISGKCKFSCS